MQDEIRRLFRYKEKLKPEIIKARIASQRKNIISQKTLKTLKEVQIEEQVKNICRNEKSILLFEYLAYAKKIWHVVEKHGPDPRFLQPFFNVWASRGLKADLLNAINVQVFNSQPLKLGLPNILGARLWLRYEEGSGNIAYDSSGYGHNATLQNVELSPYGKIGGCAHHSQITAVQVVKHSPDFAPQGGQAVVFWIKEPYEERAAWLAKKTDFTNGWEMLTDWVDGMMLIDVFVYSNGRARGTFAFIEPDKWNHVVFLWLPDAIKIYVNGTLSTQSDSPGLGFSGTDLLIGEFPSFYGFIDEFMFFNRPLSEDEINKLYNWTGV
jgi:hypothetical protein